MVNETNYTTAREIVTQFDSSYTNELLDIIDAREPSQFRLDSRLSDDEVEALEFWLPALEMEVKDEIKDSLKRDKPERFTSLKDAASKVKRMYINFTKTHHRTARVGEIIKENYKPIIGAGIVLSSAIGGGLLAKEFGPQLPDIPSLITYAEDSGDEHRSESAGTEYQITEDANLQTNPTIHKNAVAWEDDRNGNKDIYVKDLKINKETRITSADSLDKFPDIYEGKLVYVGGDYIKLYNLGTGIEKTISEDPGDKTTYDVSFPQIDGDNVIWHASWFGSDWIPGGGIFKYNIKTGETELISDIGTFTAISGNNIAFEANYSIFIYDITTGETKEVINSNSNIDESYGHPDIDGTLVVFEKHNAGNIDIYLKDLSTGEVKPICTESGPQINPKVDGKFVTWSSGSDYLNNKVYLYNLETGTKTLVSTGKNSEIHNGKMVFESKKDGDWEIYLYDTNQPSGIEEKFRELAPKFYYAEGDEFSNHFNDAYKRDPEKSEVFTHYVKYDDLGIEWYIFVTIYGESSWHGKFPHIGDGESVKYKVDSKTGEVLETWSSLHVGDVMKKGYVRDFHVENGGHGMTPIQDNLMAFGVFKIDFPKLGEALTLDDYVLKPLIEEPPYPDIDAPWLGERALAPSKRPSEITDPERYYANKDPVEFIYGIVKDSPEFGALHIDELGIPVARTGMINGNEYNQKEGAVYIPKLEAILSYDTDVYFVYEGIRDEKYSTNIKKVTVDGDDVRVKEFRGNDLEISNNEIISIYPYWENGSALIEVSSPSGVKLFYSDLTLTGDEFRQGIGKDDSDNGDGRKIPGFGWLEALGAGELMRRVRKGRKSRN